MGRASIFTLTARRRAHPLSFLRGCADEMAREMLSNYMKNMVGDTGIEPVTPAV
jgi:hypothetical protein